MPESEGSTWHSYVISYEGKDSIHGCRQGDLEAVTMAIEEIVTLLNERHLGHFRKPGRVHVALTPKKKDAGVVMSAKADCDRSGRAPQPTLLMRSLH